MTSEGATGARRWPLAVAGLAVCLSVASARAAEPPYGFEGTWIRSTRVCAANAPNPRTYTAHDVTFNSGRCLFRKIAAGSGQYEIFEECRRSDHPGNFTETIRMLGPDLMQVRRQVARLKIARALRFTRCNAAAPKPAAAPPPVKPAPAAPPPGRKAGQPPEDARPADVKP